MVNNKCSEDCGPKSYIFEQNKTCLYFCPIEPVRYYQLNSECVTECPVKKIGKFFTEKINGKEETIYNCEDCAKNCDIC